jgi:hypothetical protein
MFGARDEQIRRQSAHAVGVYGGVVVLLGGVVALGGGGRSRTAAPGVQVASGWRRA